MTDTPDTVAHPLPLTVRQRMVAQRAGLSTLAEQERRGLDTYYADQDALKQRIHPFSSLESADKLDWRRKMTIDHYEPNVGEIADSYAEMVYGSGEVTRAVEGNESLNAYFKDTYGPWWENEVAPVVGCVPEAFIYLDMPAGPSFASAQDQGERRAWARPSVVFGSSVTNLERNEDGALRWISRTMEHCDVVGETTKRQTWYEVRDAFNIYALGADGSPVPMLATSDGQRVAIHPHGMGGVPVVPVVRKWRTQHGGARGIAHFASVVDKSLGQLQVISMLVEAGYMHLTLDLMASGETAAALKREGRGNASIIPVGTDTEGGEKIVEPKYLEKPVEIVEILFRWAYEEIPAGIYKSARLRNRSTTRTMNQSGIAKAFDAVPEFAAVRSYASWLRNPDAECVRLIATSLVPDLAPALVRCDYPSRFTTQATNELVEEIVAIGEGVTSGALPKSEAFITEYMLALFRARFPDAPAATVEAVTRQIAAAFVEPKPEPPKEEAKPGLLGVGRTIVGDPPETISAASVTALPTNGAEKPA
jgi:hypothetical protein